jgi:hypothetical protein
MSEEEGSDVEFEEEGSDGDLESKKKERVKFPCPHPTCPAKFTTKSNRTRHYNTMHVQEHPVYDCIFCGSTFARVIDLREHRKTHEPYTGFRVRECAFRKRCVIFRKPYPQDILTLDQAFAFDGLEVENLLKFELAKRNHMMVSIIYGAEFIRTFHSDRLDELDKYDVNFRASSTRIFNEAQISPFLKSTRNYTQTRIDDFLENVSNVKMLMFTLMSYAYFNMYSREVVGSYSSFFISMWNFHQFRL